MKKLIIIVLLLLVFGLYFYTAETKELMQKTGMVIKHEIISFKEDFTSLVEENSVSEEKESSES
jgi:hypothetical protein|tara:strand:+ start:67247 stop:67438 length:192 start_codon:yes stop_codon:yes gene_type:complete